MALDDILASEYYRDEFAAIIRLYRWERPTLSCGFHQVAESRVSFENCKTQGVDIVRRPTGGRELLHENDLSFSITRFTTPLGGKAIALARANFMEACNLIGMVLASFGIRTHLASGRRKREVSGPNPCSASASQFELLWENKKIVPMAQRVYPNAILVHGSIPIVRQSINTGSLLKTTDPEGLQRTIDKSTSNLEEILGKQPDISGLVKGFLESIQVMFKGEANCLGFSKQELSRASKRAFNWSIKLNQN